MKGKNCFWVSFLFYWVRRQEESKFYIRLIPYLHIFPTLRIFLSFTPSSLKYPMFEIVLFDVSLVWRVAVVMDIFELEKIEKWHQGIECGVIETSEFNIGFSFTLNWKMWHREEGWGRKIKWNAIIMNIEH